MESSQDIPAGNLQLPVTESTHVEQELTSAVTVNTESGMPADHQGYEDEDYDYYENYYDDHDFDYTTDWAAMCMIQARRGMRMIN
jgi:hypothetical protein